MTTIQGRVPVIERNESHGWFVYASDEEFHYLTDHGWHHCCPVFFTTREAAQAFIDAHADLTATLTPELLAKGERYAGKESLKQFIAESIERARKLNTGVPTPIAGVCIDKDSNALEVTLDSSKSSYGDWIPGEGADITLQREMQTDKVTGARLPLYAKTVVIGGNFPSIRIDVDSGSVFFERDGNWLPAPAPVERAAVDDDEVCHCGMLMREHHQGSSCTTPKSMGSPP